MAALPVSASLIEGDFLDKVAESTLRSMVDRLKVEYRKEFCKAMEAANLQAATGAGIGHVGTPMVVVTAPPNMPVAESGEDPLRLAGVLQMENVSEPPFMDKAGGCVTCPPPRATSRLSPRGGAWVESRTKSLSKNTGSSCGRSQHSAAQCYGEPTHASNRPDKQQGMLSAHERESIKNIMHEDIAEEENVLAKRASRASGLKAPAPGEASQCRMLSYRLIASPLFDLVVGVVIVLNALTIGMETSFSRHGREMPASLHILEYTFTMLYCVELAMRVYVSGVSRAFSNNWVRFDAVMVAVGILNFLLTMTSLGGIEAAGAVENINMLKMLRLFRLARTVRLLVQFRTLWMLVQGLMHAVLPMFWTAILMSVVIYVFAVIAMEIVIVSDGDDDYSIAARKYDTIGESMLTLVQVLTLDSAAAMYRPLIVTKPWLCIYFLIFILLGPIALMNIVTAIMVESSLRTATEDQEAKKAWNRMRRKALTPRLRSIFFALDSSGDGEVDLEELLNAPPEIKEAIQHIVGMDELDEVFRLMDYDGSGVIDIGEFVDGIMRSQADKPSELFVLVKQGKAILDRLQGLGPRPSAVVGADDGVPRDTRDRESLAT